MYLVVQDIIINFGWSNYLSIKYLYVLWINGKNITTTRNIRNNIPAGSSPRPGSGEEKRPSAAAARARGTHEQLSSTAKRENYSV